MITNEIFDVVIIGSGPAGYGAGIYAARADRKTLILAGVEHGGQLMLTTEIENFPGIDPSTTGPELMKKMETQAKSFGAAIVYDDAVRVDASSYPYVVVTSHNSYAAKTIILATGASARKLGLDREKELTGRGVSYCATCDAYFFKDKIVGVVGGGDAAMEEALHLSKFAKQVIIIHRSDILKAQKVMQNRVRANEKISFLFNKQVIALHGEMMLKGITLKDSVSGEESSLDVQGLFIAIGHEPNTKIFSDAVSVDERGYIVLPDARLQQTSREGIFAAGDVCDPFYKQAVIAAGSGVQASLEAERYLESRKDARQSK